MRVAADGRRRRFAVFPRTRSRPAPVAGGVLLLAAAAVLALAVLAVPADARTRDVDQPIHIRAQRVEANEKTGVSVYRGDVVLTQGSLRLEADRLEVQLRGGSTERIRAWGKPARLRSRTESGEDIRASAERIEYRAAERLLDLYGDVELYRGADLLTGAIVHYALDRGTFTAESEKDGRVTAVIQPAKKETAP
ncbi:MAG TPA: lipopolysaccharide transport periplasmic protein LptA [Burkholderiales bacterium]